MYMCIWLWRHISVHLNIHERQMRVFQFTCYLFAYFSFPTSCHGGEMLICKFPNFSDAFSTAIFSFWFVSHSFRKSPRSDTLIQSTKNTYTWQMTHHHKGWQIFSSITYLLRSTNHLLVIYFLEFCFTYVSPVVWWIGPSSRLIGFWSNVKPGNAIL